MKFSVVTDDAGLRDLEPEWRSLFARARAGDPMPFQSPDWLLPWWACFGTGRPVVAAAEDGLLACYLLDDKLLPMGAGLTDYQDLLLAADAAPEAPAALLRGVLEAARSQGAREFHFPDLPLRAALRALPPPSPWTDELIEADIAPILVLPPGASLRDVIGPSRLRDTRQAQHRAERAGGFTLSQSSSPRKRGPVSEQRACSAMGSRFRGDDERGWPVLENLHTHRWRAAGAPGVLADPTVRAFHQIAAPRLIEAGLLSIPVLYIAGQPAAACYVLHGTHRRYLYLSGYDPKFQYESPGTILLAHIVETAMQDGVRELHFLRGDEPYKRAWGAVAHRNVLRAFRPA